MSDFYISKNGRKTRTLKKFIKDCLLIHNDKYFYDLTEDEYRNNSKINITCKNCGIFSQHKSSHLKGHGCAKCNGGVKDTLENFIEKSNKTHNNYYDYNKVIYSNAHKKVEIICPIHGVFSQLPYNHSSGQGCNKCGSISTVIKQQSNTQEFIDKAINIHSKYDYSLAVYINSTTKIKIICPYHGVFEQTPNNHLQGKGCKYCHDIKIYTNRKTILYYLKIDKQYKIGVVLANNMDPVKAINKRYKQELKANINLNIEGYNIYKDGKDAYLLEQNIIKYYNKYLIYKKDMILYSGFTETFNIDILKEWRRYE